jgi:hypothetical protein
MNILDPNLLASLQAAPDSGIRPVYFSHFVAKNRITGAVEPLGFWSGDEDLTVNVETPDGGMASRTYVGGCNLGVEGVTYVLDLTDNPLTVSLSQIADAVQQMVRGWDVRLADAEIHATTMTGGAFTAPPELLWVGIVDDVQIETPEAGGDGAITLSVRSELMAQLTATNPAKSSDAHQRRRQAGDRFSEYSGVIGSRSMQWYHTDG